MVRDESRVTPRSAVRWMVLKSALAPEPLAILPLAQFTAALQFPLASFVQVPGGITALVTTVSVPLAARLLDQARPVFKAGKFNVAKTPL